jgi:hypothetical protein
MKLLTDFWDWVDERHVVRRAVLGVTVYMSYISFTWAAHFAETTNKGGAEVGLIIGAVTGPVAALQAFILKVYSESRDK